jgi:hypothetical protein
LSLLSDSDSLIAAAALRAHATGLIATSEAVANDKATLDQLESTIRRLEHRGGGLLGR